MLKTVCFSLLLTVAASKIALRVQRNGARAATLRNYSAYDRERLGTDFNGFNQFLAMELPTLDKALAGKLPNSVGNCHSDPSGPTPCQDTGNNLWYKHKSWEYKAWLRWISGISSLNFTKVTAAPSRCCWDRNVQGCNNDGMCDARPDTDCDSPPCERCLLNNSATKEYGRTHCTPQRCCWNRNLQSCNDNDTCDPRPNGDCANGNCDQQRCIVSGTYTKAYGTAQCNYGCAGDQSTILFTFEGAFRYLTASIHIEECATFDDCHTLWDNTDACCGTNKHFTLTVGACCDESTKTLAWNGFFETNLEMDDIHIDESVGALPLPSVDITDAIKAAVASEMGKYLNEPIIDYNGIKVTLAQYVNAVGGPGGPIGVLGLVC